MADICLIFDLDGTLVQSEEACNQALIDLIPELGGTLDDMVGRNRGRKLEFILTDIELRLGRALPPDFVDRYRARVSELFSMSLRPVNGVPEMLSALVYPKCVASGAPPAKIKHALDLTGLAGHFGERVFSSYVVNSWKPDPGLFLFAANAMGYQPRQCVVIEDSDVGVQGAAAAGMKVLHFTPQAGGITANGVVQFASMARMPHALHRLLSSPPPASGTTHG